MTVNAVAAGSIVKRTAGTLGCALPPGFVAAAEKANTLVAAADNIGAGPQRLHSAILDALEQGKDLYTDKQVARALAEHTLSAAGVGGAARARADEYIVNGLVEFVDEFLDAWATALQEPSAALAAAAEQLPDGVDAQAALAAGGRALHAFASMTEAQRLWVAGLEGAAMLCMTARVTIIPTTRPCLMADADLQVFNEIRRTEQVDPWALARHNVRLSLPRSLGEIMARIADLEQQFQAAQAEAAERERKVRWA